MLILPLGLVSKTKNIPIATIVISVITVFFSILNFPLNKKAENVYWESENRVAFATEAKKWIISECHLNQAKTFCQGLNKIPEKVFLLGEKAERAKPKRSQSSQLYGYISEELKAKNLQKKNPQLFYLYQASQLDLKEQVIKYDLFSSYNLSWTANLKAIFLHGGYLHLLGNLLILIFLAFPVEERMGSMLFTGMYIGSGLLGNLAHCFLTPDTFYLVGASGAISGVAGAFTYFFWKNYARVFVSFFLVFSQTLVIPVFIYAPIFMIASDLVGTLDTLTNTAHLAHLGGLLGGLACASIFNLMLPMPEYFTYPFEYEFYEESKNNLSQYDRMKVFAKWLYYAPINLHAFKALVKEFNRGSTNPKVQKLINHFREHSFNDVYQLNRKKDYFLKILPLPWLTWIPAGEDPVYLKKKSEHFKELRDFQTAFKMNFLVLNEVGWSDYDWGLELFKNYKKASVDKKFSKQAEKLRMTHSAFNSIVVGKTGEDVRPA